MLNQIYIHYINTLFVLESFIISCWLLKGKKIGIGIGIGQFARKKSVSESATKNHDRCITIYIYTHSICIVKADSRFILFYFVLYICIHVAPWSSVARHFVPLYVHRCSGMTIKIGRMSVYVKIVTYTWLGDTLTWYFGVVSYTIVCYLTFLCRFHIKYNSLLPI